MVIIGAKNYNYKSGRCHELQLELGLAQFGQYWQHLENIICYYFPSFAYGISCNGNCRQFGQL